MPPSVPYYWFFGGEVPQAAQPLISIAAWMLGGCVHVQMWRGGEEK